MISQQFQQIIRTPIRNQQQISVQQCNKQQSTTRHQLFSTLQFITNQQFNNYIMQQSQGQQLQQQMR